MGEFYFRVGFVGIMVAFTEEWIAEYLEKEYGLLREHSLSEDVKVNIMYRNDYTVVQENIYCGKLVARGRITYFELRSDSKYLEVNVYIKKQACCTVKKFISPFYESIDESCLADFFHGPFLGILQIKLLEKRQSLFHASMFYKEKNAIVLAGGAQCGKSRLAIEMLQRYDGGYCSEDFCIITADTGEIYSLPHQSRVKKEQLKQIGYQNQGILDSVNLSIYAKISPNRAARRLPVEKIFKNSKYVRNGNAAIIYLLDRSVIKSTCIEEVPIDSAVAEFMNILNIEFINMKYVETCINGALCFEGGYMEMMERTKTCISDFCKSKKIVHLRLPIYSDINITIENLNNLIDD